MDKPEETSPLLYPPFVYRLLFKLLQFSLNGDADDLMKDVKTSELDRWDKDFKVGCSRNTLLKIMGRPNKGNESITDRTLDAPSAFLLQRLTMPGRDEPFNAEDLKGERFGSDYYKAFLFLLDCLKFPEEIVGTEQRTLIKSDTNRYFYKLDEDERNLINEQVIAVIKYNFVAEDEEEKQQSLSNFLNRLDSFDISFQRYFESNKPRGSKEEALRLGLFRVHDGILPSFFRGALKANLYIDIVIFDSWGDGLRAFVEDRVDAIIHNFATALTGRLMPDGGQISDLPTFFWPLFSSEGYALIAKKGVDFQADKSIQFISEVNTDMDLVARNWLTNKFPAINVEVINTPIIEHVERFLEDPAAGLLATNCINMISLLRDREKASQLRLLTQGAELGHRNFNGLICSPNLIANKPKAVRDLIYTLYRIQDYLLDEIIYNYASQRNTVGSLVLESTVSEDRDDQDEILAESITTFINNQTKSNLAPRETIDMYNAYNTFFTSPKLAYDAFLDSNHLGNRKVMQQYYEIALAQLERIPELKEEANYLRKMQGESLEESLKTAQENTIAMLGAYL